MPDPFIGQIQAFAFNFAPRGWAKCDGQLLQISSNTALFSLLGTTYGGDGRTTFALPDLRGRVPVHQGTGPGLSAQAIGAKSGVENVTLTTAEMPNHTHLLNAVAEPADTAKPESNLLASAMIYHAPTSGPTLANTAIGNTGNGMPHTNMQPFLVINWCIALVGEFPSRN